MSSDLDVFEAERAHLLALAYRMLGELGRAEDLVQEAWLRWSARDASIDVRSPRAYLATLTTRLCLSELDSARRRREESRSDRLPEPIDLAENGLERIETIERVSMAFLVALQRLTPAERAVLLLHDVFDLDHAAIAELVGKTTEASRKLLERARLSLESEKRLLVVPRETHARLLEAFVQASYRGDTDALVRLLAADAVMITDGGEEGRSFGGVKNLRAPLHGAPKVAAFVIAATKRGGVLASEIRDLNGRPALVLRDANGPFAALTIVVDETTIHRVYFHGDLRRLAHVGTAIRSQTSS